MISVRRCSLDSLASSSCAFVRFFRGSMVVSFPTSAVPCRAIVCFTVTCRSIRWVWLHPVLGGLLSLR